MEGIPKVLRKSLAKGFFLGLTSTQEPEVREIATVLSAIIIGTLICVV